MESVSSFGRIIPAPLRPRVTRIRSFFASSVRLIVSATISSSNLVLRAELSGSQVASVAASFSGMSENMASGRGAGSS